MADISCGLEFGRLSGECMCDQFTEIFRVCLGSASGTNTGRLHLVTACNNHMTVMRVDGTEYSAHVL
jgi:hypothetical protein